jgi:hypothetical protein
MVVDLQEVDQLEEGHRAHPVSFSEYVRDVVAMRDGHLLRLREVLGVERFHHIHVAFLHRIDDVRLGTLHGVKRDVVCGLKDSFLFVAQ